MTLFVERAVAVTGVPFLCRVSRSDQVQAQEFARGLRSYFRAGWLPASHWGQRSF